MFSKPKPNEFLEAARAGDTGKILLLLAAKADVNQADSSGQIALHLSLTGDHIRCAKILMENNADVNRVTKRGYTPLYIAASHGFTAIVESLIEYKAEVNVMTDRGGTPLHIAAQRGRTASVESLLKHKAEVNAVTTDGSTPLILAAGGGHTASVESLLKHKADIHAVTAVGATPLYVAAREGHIDNVKSLIGHKANVNAVMFNGYTTPLSGAFYGEMPTKTEHARWSTCRLLVEAKADSSGVPEFSESKKNYEARCRVQCEQEVKVVREALHEREVIPDLIAIVIGYCHGEKNTFHEPFALTVIPPPSPSWVDRLATEASSFVSGFMNLFGGSTPSTSSSSSSSSTTTVSESKPVNSTSVPLPSSSTTTQTTSTPSEQPVENSQNVHDETDAQQDEELEQLRAYYGSK